MSNTSYLVVVQQSTTNISVTAPMPDEFAFDVGASYEQMLPQGFFGGRVLNIAAAAAGTKLAVQAFTAQLWAGNTDTLLSVELVFHTETDPVADVRTPIVNLLKLTMPSISGNTGFLNNPGPSIDWSIAGQAVGTGLGQAAAGVGSLFGSAASGVVNFASSALGALSKQGSMTDSNTQVADGANNTVAQALSQNPSIGTAAYWKSRVKNQISIKVGNYLMFDSVVVTNVNLTFASNFDAQTGLPHNARVSVTFKPLFMLTQQDLDTLFINPGSNTTPSGNNLGFTLPGQSTPITASNFGLGI
jgi:hypothetical protein